VTVAEESKLPGDLLDQLTPQECYDCKHFADDFREDFNPRALKCWKEQVAGHLSHQRRSRPDELERMNRLAAVPEAPPVVQRAQTLDSVVSRITPANLHEETHWGAAVGNEL
jgi:hypothetical protein